MRGPITILFACASMATLAACALMGNNVRTQLFDCDGRRMIVSFDDTERTASISLAGEPLRVLPQTAVGEGYYVYSNGRSALRYRAREVRWEAERGASVACGPAS